jgi:hypothetical protein
VQSLAGGLAGLPVARLDLIEHCAERTHAHGSVDRGKEGRTIPKNCSKASRQVASKVRSVSAARIFNRRCKSGLTGVTTSLWPCRDAA